MYKIQPRTFEIAKELGLSVYPSDNTKYKIEIYDKDGIFMFYGGDNNYKDFHIYTKEDGLPYAKERQRLYKIRHAKEIAKVGSRGWIIYKLLWF